jgi:hypothetical protein
MEVTQGAFRIINPLNAKLNPICHLLELLGAHPIFHVSRIRVKIEASIYPNEVGSRFLWKVVLSCQTSKYHVYKR